MPELFVDEGWGLAQLAPALVVLVIEIVALFFARVLMVWLYGRTGRSVLLVAVFHASFNATISELVLRHRSRIECSEIPRPERRDRPCRRSGDHCHQGPVRAGTRFSSALATGFRPALARFFHVTSLTST